MFKNFATFYSFEHQKYVYFSDQKSDSEKEICEGGYGIAGLPTGSENLTPHERHILRFCINIIGTDKINSSLLNLGKQIE